MNAIGLGVTYRIFLAFGPGAQPVVFVLGGNGTGIAEVGKPTVYMDEGAT